ncbi:SGNH/GDSL hydrolase family protein [Nocardioides insulae]|uniref:SGNH/GDSL hydrolase family protein n=1 Tax=Nocardioides insulae TaxID=394734 RepID=UPI0004171170|nr:SGNH/GDSL hydrolase family protein [Nocardioides insulae]
MTSHRTLAALGSSFAAGPGIEPVADLGAMRSGRNYAHLLADRLGADLVDLSVSGATTATILDEPQQTMHGAEFPPQIQGVPENADAVTVTAGGNDLHFIGSMLFSAWMNRGERNPMVDFLAATFQDGIPIPTESAVQAVADGLTRIVAETRRRAPGARVILVDYLTLVGDDTGPGAGTMFTEEQLKTFREIQAGLQRGYEIAAQRSGADLLRASELSTEHALGAVDPWVFDYQATLEESPRSFHPNERGMAAVTDALAALLSA